MKKIFLSVLSIALVAGTMSSCGKTSKGKVSDEWNLTKSEYTSSNTSSGTTTTSSGTTTITGTTLVDTQTSGGQTQTTNGTANKYTYTFKKDGTFEINTDLTYTNSGTGYTTTNNSVGTETGTWSFVGKNKADGFKTNERIVLNTLSSTDKSTTTTTYNGQSTTSNSSSSNTWKVGENSQILTVVESTGKKLVLSSEWDNTSSNTNSNNQTTTSSSKGTGTITLEK